MEIGHIEDQVDRLSDGVAAARIDASDKLRISGDTVHKDFIPHQLRNIDFCADRGFRNSRRREFGVMDILRSNPEDNVFSVHSLINFLTRVRNLDRESRMVDKNVAAFRADFGVEEIQDRKSTR